MIAFTILGVLVWLVACYRAGWWLGLALDVLVHLWAMRKLDPLLSGVIACTIELEAAQA